MPLKLLVTTTFVLLALLTFVQPVSAESVLTRQGHVNDFTSTLKDETKNSLEEKLTQFKNDFAIDVVVVTVKSLEKQPIKDYATTLFKDWEISNEMGVIFLLAPNERELRIETGNDFKQNLNDAQISAIIRGVVTPELQKNDFNSGVVKGVDAIIKTAKGEEVVSESPQKRESPEPKSALLVLLTVGTVFLSYLAAFLARSKSIWPGGIIGGFLGGICGWLTLFSGAAVIVGAIGLGLVGLVLDMIFSKNYKRREQKGLETNWRQSGGGFLS